MHPIPFVLAVAQSPTGYAAMAVPSARLFMQVREQINTRSHNVSCALSLNVPTATKFTGPRQSKSCAGCVACLLPARPQVFSAAHLTRPYKGYLSERTAVATSQHGPAHSLLSTWPMYKVKARIPFSPPDINFRAAVYDEDNRVCWGPLQIPKDTRRIPRSLYNCPFGIQALELENRIRPEFLISDTADISYTFVVPKSNDVVDLFC